MTQRVPLTVRLMEGRSVQEVAHQDRSGLTKAIQKEMLKAPYLGFLMAIDLGPWSAVK